MFVKIDVGGHYHIARSPIVEIRRRICIGFAFGHESGSPHFVLRRWMAEAFSLSCVRCAEGSRVSHLAKEGPGGQRGLPPRRARFSRGISSVGLRSYRRFSNVINCKNDKEKMYSLSIKINFINTRKNKNNFY